MRVGITGAHGVGKTTLAKGLAETLDYTLVKEQVRETATILGVGSPKEVQTDPVMFSMLQWESLKNQIRMEQPNSESFVTDRIALDYLIYYMIGPANQDPQVVVDSYVDIVVNHMLKPAYDIILYVPIMFDVVDDGYRFMNKDFQQMVDEAIKYGLEVFRGSGVQTKVVNVNELDQEKRLVEALKVVKGG